MKITQILFYSLMWMMGFLGSARADNLTSGTCGEKCTWKFEGKTLTISGTGPMEDTYDRNVDRPWQNLYSSIQNIVIDDGITAISGIAFRELPSVKNVSIGKGVTSIGGQAFYELTNVQGALTIPEGVTTIGGWAFRNMTGVTSLVIPKSVTTIGDEAFRYMGNVTGELQIPEKVTTIGSLAFGNMSGVTGELKIPQGVTTIGERAFENMSGVASVIIPETVTSIGTGAFNGMTSLGDVFLSAEGGLSDSKLIAASIDLNKIVRYTKDGKYIKGDQVYASLEDYKAGITFVYNENKGKYQKIDKNGVLLDGIYRSDGSRIVYRIYTVEEANEALGTDNRNTFSIRYR